jgi:predicted TIM-barrel fold metal-dependent hydrolase
MTDLAHHIQTLRIIDTHEHIFKEDEFITNGPDVLQDLFHTYIASSLENAGASSAAVDRLIDASDPDVEGRWNAVKEAWHYSQYTSYGEAVRLTARLVYGMDDINLTTILAAADRNAELRQPGGRLHLLRDVANLDHIQVDDFTWACPPDESGPGFFLYDLSWVGFCRGEIPVQQLYEETQIEVRDLMSLRQAMTSLFAQYAGCAIAVKAQHAYDRTLAWHERDETDVEPILQKVLREEAISDAERLCLGDWCWARGVELATEHNLPFKLHTGYMVYNNTMIQPDRLRTGHLAPLLMRYPNARFVLMHMAYPYTDELVAIAKNFPGVYVDMCWGWSMDLNAAIEFMRKMIHAVPFNKVFAFGGDTLWPAQTVGYAAQARAGLTRALQAEVDAGSFSEAEAIHLATCMLRDNQMACFDIEGTRAAIRAQMARIPS